MVAMLFATKPLAGALSISIAACLTPVRAADPETNEPNSTSARPSELLFRHFSLADHPASFQAGRIYDLPALIELSLANNPYTRSAWFKALSTAAAVGEARAPYYPQLSFNATGGYSQTPYPTASGPLAVNNVEMTPGFQLEYLLLDFGRRAADVRNTMALLEAASFDYDRKLQTTLFAVQQSYFAHSAALAQQEAAQANIVLSRTLRYMVSAQKKSGLATEPDLLAADKTLSQAEFDLSTAQRNVAVTLGNLRIAAGLPANAPLKVATPEHATGNATNSSPLEILSGKVDQLIDTAIASRPDLAARTADVRASQAATERAKAEFLPKLSLQGSYNSYTYGFHARQGPSTGTSYGNYNEMGGFAVLSWDLFDGFERVEKLKKRRAEEAEARSDAEATRLETTRDVWTAYNDSIKARRQVEYAASLAGSARENFDSLQAAFKNGLANITDLLSSESALADARFEQAGAQADYLTSLASLSLAMGQFQPTQKPALSTR
jgi:outer membrane protein